MFKVVVAGGRKFNDYELLKYTLDHLLCNKSQEDMIIVSGTASGADSLGERYGREMGFEIKQFPANWDEFGKSAGYIRNEEMAKYSDAVVVFWDGESKGSKHMIDLAKKHKKQVRVIVYEK